MSTGKDIEKLVKQLGLHYGNPAKYPHVSVHYEPAWRLTSEENPAGELVQSVEQAEIVLRAWRTKFDAERSKQAVAIINERMRQAIEPPPPPRSS